jgi:hypothetical protein
MNMRLILILAVLLAGCVTSGNKIDLNEALAFRTGTPLAAVVEKIGKPNSTVTGPHGGKLLLWSYVHANGMTGKSEAQSVALLFDAGGRFVRVVSTTETEMH